MMQLRITIISPIVPLDSKIEKDLTISIPGSLLSHPIQTGWTANQARTVL